MTWASLSGTGVLSFVIVSCELLFMLDQGTLFEAGLVHVTSFLLLAAKVVNNVLRVQATPHAQVALLLQLNCEYVWFLLYICIL
jgi:hypothetical protein